MKCTHVKKILTMSALRSKTRCIARIACRKDISHFAAFFIDMGPKRSIVRSHKNNICKKFCHLL